ncbi:C-C motif chemokine 20 [Labeo rohita]|uniref:C-C motif chemokine 20 n=1 Tax=Labeo rohita TaxID=84645 RepID=A0ABQ8LF34_LABRO|nr:C-C motif chemokine 20 [Labeo rohita]
METDAVTCCLKYKKTPLPCRILKGYDIQATTGGCDLAAIMMKAAMVKSGGF